MENKYWNSRKKKENLKLFFNKNNNKILFNNFLFPFY